MSLKTLILRGPVLNWWALKRAKQTDSVFLRNVVKEMQQPLRAEAAEASKTLDLPKTALRRILFIGDFMWEQDQLFPELKKICQLDILDLRPAIKGKPDGAMIIPAKIAEYARTTRSQEPDLILLYLRPSLLSEEVFSAVRSNWSCPLLGMNLDDRVEFFPNGILQSGNDDYARWICSFDLNLTSSLSSLDWYRRRGANVRYFPQGFKPDAKFALPPVLSDFEIPVSFVGSWKPERGEVIDNLAQYGIHPALYGRGWPEGQWIEDPATVFRSSQINLGIGYASASAKIANAKGRDIECPGAGACYLTTYHWELSEMFEIGKEVLAYRNVEELLEMLSFYTRRPDSCLKIAKAAHRRAHAEHTWEKRWRDLFKEMAFETATP